MIHLDEPRVVLNPSFVRQMISVSLSVKEDLHMFRQMALPNQHLPNFY